MKRRPRAPASADMFGAPVQQQLLPEYQGQAVPLPAVVQSVALPPGQAPLPEQGD